MRVLMVADARSVHTRRWAVSLLNAGVDIAVYSIYPSGDSFFEDNDVRLYEFDLFTYRRSAGLRSMASMLSRHSAAVRSLRQVISRERPDILHAHYVTSFGLIAALTGFHPLVVSVWGSDVYEFPYQSALNRLSVKFILRSADKILSTSHVMARQTSRFTSRDIEVIPFGVDTGIFRSYGKIHYGPFVVGNVKTLSPKYGIDVLIRAFSLVREHNPGTDLRLVIVGDGPSRDEYVRLASELGVGEDTVFEGRVPNTSLPEYYNSFSVAVSLSRNESFGVVAVEAMSCGCPVIVSDAEGFTEVVADGLTGIVVPKDDPAAAAAAIQRFIDDPSLRDRMGNEGAERARSLYDWKDSVAKMINVYRNVRRS